MLPVASGKRFSKMPDPRESLGKYWDFPSPKIRFFSHEIQFSWTAFCFLQWLSAFFNGFPIFLNGFPIFLNGFPLSEKSEKIYLRRQVYKRSPFKLGISRHSLPELCNSCYNAYISPNTRCLDCPIPFCLIYDSGGVSQWHRFEITIVDLPYVFILDFYVFPSQPADEHSRALFLFNLLPCCTLPPPRTHAEAIPMLMVMLPMPDSSNASNRAFKKAAITFCSW